MNVSEYLSSPQAVEDVQALLALPHWSVLPIRPWMRINCRALVRAPGTGDHHIYVRPDGDRYVVTDLGEAVRALRLRTGVLDVGDLADEHCRVEWQDEHGRPATILRDPGDALRTSNTCESNPECYDTVSAADLPRAICAVLLAAHKVASLEVPA